MLNNHLENSDCTTMLHEKRHITNSGFKKTRQTWKTRKTFNFTSRTEAILYLSS